MGDGKSPWPLVVILGMALTCVTILALNDVDTTDVIAVLTLLALPILGLPVFSRLETLKRDAELLKQQTNGQTERRDLMIEQVVKEYLRQQQMQAMTANQALAASAAVTAVAHEQMAAHAAATQVVKE